MPLPRLGRALRAALSIRPIWATASETTVFRLLDPLALLPKSRITTRSNFWPRKVRLPVKAELSPP